VSTRDGGAPQSRGLLLAGGAIALVGAIILAAAITGRPNPAPSPSASLASPSAATSPVPPSPSAASPLPSPSLPSPSPSPPLAIDVRISGDDPFVGCRAGGAGRNFLSSEVEPYVAVNPTNPGNIVAVWQQDRWSNGGARGILDAVTHDGGRTWRSSTPAFTSCSPTQSGASSYPRASDPWVVFGADGVVYETALAVDTERDRTAVLVSRSTNGGSTWSTPLALAQNAGTRFNDKESIATDPNEPDLVYVIWDRTTGSEEAPGGQPQPPRGEILLARSSDGGTSWEPARLIAQPAGVPVGNVLAVLPDGVLVDVFELVVDTPRGRQASESFIRSDDGGRTWSAPKPIAAVVGRELMSPLTGNPIRSGHGLPSVAAQGSSGRIVVTWSDARFAATGAASVNAAVSNDGGRTWSAPVKVPPGATARYAFTPSVAISRSGTIGVSYYGMTVSRGRLLTDRYQATSSDGMTWREQRLTDISFDLSFAPDAFGLFLGDYAGLAPLADDRFIAVFATTNPNVRNTTRMLAVSSEATP
jgi:hypothetical protein